jgi:topoisomerase-4 subunit A
MNTDCSDIDVIVFLRDGNMMVTKVDTKTFVGKDIIHIAIFDKGDKRTTYNLIYRDGKSGPSTKKDLMFLLPEINYMI